MRAQTLYIYKLTKVAVVDQKKNLVFTAFSVVPAGVQGFNDVQKITVVSLISSFSQNYLLKKVDYLILLTKI